MVEGTLLGSNLLMIKTCVLTCALDPLTLREIHPQPITPILVGIDAELIQLVLTPGNRFQRVFVAFGDEQSSNHLR